ncbi:MurR/RpiR family transcriptional regulator [Lactobacillus paragasseri]|uniref:MurR/RpiR family transcriptional regulator n=1 Tax=Lactobacillus paragasseri TaxID=2107999 RepID=UPI002549D5A5|nr:MurR/RpiR family transcriptional regulator [Lactobacillus paragasseri]MDK7068569.1 MurR/RpiR family transcriptional regulator [Lactobacillus paragasseri]
MTDLKRRVLEKNGELSESEKEIVRFLFSNSTLCSHLSLAKLAKKLYVSESSIFRLCKKIGLSGYSELRFELSDLTHEKKMNTIDVATEVENASQEVLNYYNTLDLEKVFSDIECASTIYLYSTGWSQELIAKYLAHELFIIGKRAVILPSAIEELRIVSRRVVEGDMLFIISYSGDNIQIRDEISKIKLLNNKITTVSFTTLRPAELISLVDYSFFFRTLKFKKFSGGGEEATNDAFSPAYTFIDLLIAKYYQWEEQKGELDNVDYDEE